MIYIMKNGGHDTYNIKQFTLDTPDDLPNLPTSGIAVGSAALVISTSDVYMLNSKGEWDLIASDAEGILPSYSAEDAGKILEVGEGGILAWAANNALPSVTSEDEGKVLKVDDQGEWVAAEDSNTQYTAGDNISIDANNEISAVDTTYSAGANVSISNENVISATDTKYTAGSGIEISEQNVISNIAKGNTDIIAEEYDSTKAYAVGDYCIYEDKLYKCTTAITASNWLKAPQTLGTFSVTVNSENTDNTYFTQAQNGHWMVISEKSGQTINLNRVVDLTTTYTYENYYYNSHGFYQPALLPYFNGGYATESEALTDFASHASFSFDTSKWTEVTVTDEISSALELPEVSAADNDKILKVVNGSWAKGSENVLVIDCGSIQFGNAAYRLNFPNGLTCAQIFSLLRNGTYIIFKVINNDIVYYSNICTTASASDRIYIRFTDFYDTRNLTHYEYLLVVNSNTYASYNRAIKDSYVPKSSSADAGKVLTVNSSGYWGKADIPSQLPSVSSSDEGKVLTVNSSGEWVAADLPDGSNTEY